MSNKNIIIQTEIAIKFIKDTFEKKLSKKLNLIRVSAPLFVASELGLNDDLSGASAPITFETENINSKLEIIQSLAKWKRYALHKYNFLENTGLYTDMNAIRKDEVLDQTHSLYVDQWDWELIIHENNRNLRFIKKIVRCIYSVFKESQVAINKKYPELYNDLPKNITFISTEELTSLYPNLSPDEREYEITKKWKTVFIYQIGWPQADGRVHSLRAADYDDWNLNGDILFWFQEINAPLELSSMGIRVNKDSLIKQLTYKDELHKLNNKYCQGIINNILPFTIGGGIGQSRICQYFLKKIHIGEVQASVWDKDNLEFAKSKKINLL